ncbi:unnamed protein product [Allacma fusca]|uniref:Reverse transcriptase domain-containing protein n=1 Tax=Allacma fusca TaxID=39272 RepID=A0A8J2NXC4_9HEXA|nr:unnamed protein product [Allacma fusca]
MELHLMTQYKEYVKKFNENPFSEETIELGNQLASDIAESRQKKWQELVENLDFCKDSRRAWQLLKRLDGGKTQQSNFTQVTANQVAHQLLLNDKTDSKSSQTKVVRCMDVEVNNFATPITNKEVKSAIKLSKNRKAAGVDNMYTEQIKHFGPKAINWIQKVFNACIETSKMPRLWRQAHVIALQKPGKDANDPKSYRPISLLCHLYKIFERVILNHMADCIDEGLIRQQAGFRPGKSCTGQILHLTQHIEDGFEKKKVTGVVFVDLTAAFDPVCHQLLQYKVYQLTKDFKFTQIVTMLMKDRRFYVTLNGKNSTWRRQKNGLPQGSVLSPILFNIYTNDQPIGPDTNHFLYADDLALTVQHDTFVEVEDTLNQAIEELDTYYYKDNHLKPNPTKTETCSFHLRNCEAKRQLNIQWGGTDLKHADNPKYLGVTLDRSLTYKRHCEATKMKVAARTNIIRKLAGSSWGAKPQVMRASALALCYSVGEYACPVWSRSAHASKVDIPLNEACRLVTGCLRPTPLNNLYELSGIAPPAVRCEVASMVEKTKMLKNPLHPMYGYEELAETRLRSRHSFMKTVEELKDTPSTDRCRIWNAGGQGRARQEALPSGEYLKYGLWKTLNRLRCGVTRSKYNLHRWQLADDDLCECGDVQTDRHLFECELSGKIDPGKLNGTLDDEAVRFLEYWQEKGI